MTRERVARIVNLLVPGSGMILLRREWLGITLAALFTVVAQIAILGYWVVPLDIPRWLTTTGAVVTIAVWLLAQWLVWRRAGLLSAPALASELVELRQRAADALARNDHAEAHRVLLVTLSVDDEDVESAVLWARLMTAMGREDEARRGWRRVLALDAPEDHRTAAQNALAS